MEIKKATLKDFEHIFTLLKELWPNQRMTKKTLFEVYKKQLRQKKVFLLAFEDDQAVGLISLSFHLNLQCHGTNGNVDEFIVKKEYEGKGLGKKLMKEIFKIAKVKKCREVNLYSSHKRERAHKFYEEFGFTQSSLFYWKKA